MARSVGFGVGKHGGMVNRKVVKAARKGQQAKVLYLVGSHQKRRKGARSRAISKGRARY